MTTAYWWWSKSEVSVLVPVLEPPVLEPPVLANPGNLTYQVGVSVNLRIDNNGGAATTWDANALPIGLSITEEYDDHCIISGVPQALIAPSVVDPGDQTWSVGNPKNLPLSNIGGPANLWEEVDNPVNIRITESRDYSALIQNVDALPLPPLKLDYFVEYLLGQQEEQDGGYPGHGQECIDEWECYEATLDLPGCIGQLSTSLHFYDYARSSMAAYYFLQSGGMPADSRWIDYASADTKFWGLYASQLSNPYVMQGYYYFPAGQRALYDFDPVTFAQNAITLREFVDNNNWCDGANWDAGDGRETRTREFSFGILCYLDYLTLPTTAPDDPRWSIEYPADSHLLINFAYQWMDECKEFGLLDPLQYMEEIGLRLGVPGTPNLLSLSPFEASFLLESLYRIYANDTTGTVDKPMLANYCERIVNYISTFGWSINRPTGEIYRWFNRCNDPTFGPPVEPPTEQGDYWCDYRDSDGNSLWASWRLQQLGIAYALTGNRRYIDEGDMIWEYVWGTRNSTVSRRLGSAHKKENTQQLRYIFDYLKYRGVTDFKTEFGDVSGIPVPITIPTANVYPTITNAPTSQVVFVNAQFDFQLEATNNPTEWTEYLLPDGLILDDTGLISGIPTTEDASVLTTVFARNTGVGSGVGAPVVIDFAVRAPVLSVVPRIVRRGTPIRGDRINVNNPLTKGLVGYWPMLEGTGETVADYSVNGNSGTLTNMDPATNWVAGKNGYALNFDTTTTRVIIDDSKTGDFNFGDGDAYSILARIRATSTSNKIIFGKRGNSGPQYQFRIVGGGLAFTRVGGTTGPSISLNEWHHVAVVIQSDKSGEMFLGGASAGSTGTYDTIKYEDENATIGNGDDGINWDFDGDITGVSVYNRALSPSEIAQLYADPWALFR